MSFGAALGALTPSLASCLHLIEYDQLRTTSKVVRHIILQVENLMLRRRLRTVGGVTHASRILIDDVVGNRQAWDYMHLMAGSFGNGSFGNLLQQLHERLEQVLECFQIVLGPMDRMHESL